MSRSNWKAPRVAASYGNRNSGIRQTAWMGGGGGSGGGLAPSSVSYSQPKFYSPLHTPSNWQIPVKRPEVYQWCRFFANNEPKIAAALDWYSQFPIQDYENVVDDIPTRVYFDDVKRRLDIVSLLKQVAYEYFTLGDVFVFADIACPQCQGSGMIPGTFDPKSKSYEPCTHKGGTFSSISILNPDWMQVVSGGVFGQNQEVIYLMPDQNLKNIVQKKEPAEIYARIPEFLKIPILQGKPILLHPMCISHLAYNRIGYQPFGRSIIMRLFRTLAYKDKLTQAQWIVADRHIVPVRIVKVGNPEIPATESDIAQIQQQLLATSSDPNLTLVTHHAFEYDWIGASGKVLQLSKEYDMINQELLDGLMINQALLNGDGPNYANASIGIEALIQRLESFREVLARWIEERIYRPIAIMQGFTTKDEMNNIVPRYPKVKFKELNLRDDTQKKNIMMQLAESGYISRQTLLNYLGLDYNVEVDRLRMEQIVQMEYGLAGGGEEGGGMGGIGGGGGGGGMPGGDMGGGMGAGMSDDGMGGSLNMPGGGGGMEMSRPASNGFRPRVSKNRPEAKKPSKEELEAMQPQKILMNQPESKLFHMLRQGQQRQEIKYPFVPQYRPDNVHKYKVDFAFPHIKLAIEVDGDIFHENPKQKEIDKERDNYLGRKGWWVYRFPEKDINEDLPLVYQTIKELVTRKEQAIKSAEAEGNLLSLS